MRQIVTTAKTNTVSSGPTNRKFGYRYVHGNPDYAEMYITQNLNIRPQEYKTEKFSDIYKSYSEWSNSRGFVPLSVGAFETILKNKGAEFNKKGRLKYVLIEYVDRKVEVKEEIISGIGEPDNETVSAMLDDVGFNDYLESEEAKNTYFMPTENGMEVKKGNEIIVEDDKTQKQEETQPTKTATKQQEAGVIVTTRQYITDDVDDIKLKQIEIVDRLIEIQRIEFEQKISKFDKLKEQIIDNNMKNTELLNALKELFECQQ